MQKKITFFMIVTPRDILIADYSIKSYQKLYKKYFATLPFKLVIYANTFSNDLKNEYFDEWRKLPYTEIYDNEQKKIKHTEIGKVIISPEGMERTVEGKFELCDTIWSEAFLKFETPYWATVDADFEILNPDFILYMIEKMDKDDNLVVMSSDYSPTKCHLGEFDLCERYHTWFCIYKKSAQICKVSHYWFSETDENGKILVGYDSAANLQKHLREDYGFKMEACPQKYQNQFIHYGAFSKNRLIDKSNIEKFRKISIASTIGGPCQFRLFRYINKKISKHAAKQLDKYFGDTIEDRKYTDAFVLNSTDEKLQKYKDKMNSK